MFKKFFYSLLALSLPITFAAHAQDFTFLHQNPMYDTTGGTDVYDPNANSGLHDYVVIDNWITNNTQDSFVVHWRNLTVDSSITDPATVYNKWFPVGICDNISCRAEFPASAFRSWYLGETQSSQPVAPRATMLVSIHIYAPTSSPDTTEIFKVELKSPNQTDTAVFVLTKVAGTGISAVRVKDNEVSVYPNPLTGGQNLNLYINKSLHAYNAVIYNIIGQRKMVLKWNDNKEVASFDINRLPAGMYIIKVNNRQGQTITSRKFTKQ